MKLLMVLNMTFSKFSSHISSKSFNVIAKRLASRSTQTDRLWNLQCFVMNDQNHAELPRDTQKLRKYKTVLEEASCEKFRMVMSKIRIYSD